MLADGLVDEVRALREHYPLTEMMPSMRCVGYRQVWQTLAGEAPARTLRERGIAATRQLAKRQLTWLRSTHAHSLDLGADELVQKAGDIIARATS